MSLKYAESTKNISSFVEILASVFFMFTDIFKGKPKNAVKKIVLIEPFQLGDVISLTVLLNPLKKLYPDSDIYILTKQSNHYALADDARVKETLVLDFPWTNHGKKKLHLGRVSGLFFSAWRLRKYHFDLGIDCRGDIRSQIVLKVIGCDKVLGYLSYMHSNIQNRGLLLDHKVTDSPFLHRYDWNRYLLTGIGMPGEDLLPIEMPTFRVTPTRVPTFQKDNSLFKVLIHPGSGWEYKQWPHDNWLKLIRTIYQNQDVEVLVISGPGDEALLNTFRQGLTGLDIHYILTDFNQLQNAILESDIMICLDSGPMNLAVCMGKDVIGLFGPGDISKWSPYNQASKAVHFTEKFPCSPCLQKVCIFPESNCMAAISVGNVMAEFERYFKQNYKKSLTYQLK